MASPIRTADEARAYLDEAGVAHDGENVTETRDCPRCSGKGVMGWYPSSVAGGRCLKCGGDPASWHRVIRTPVLEYARKLHARRKRAEKKAAERQARSIEVEARKLESQRDWCEANGYGRITFAERDAQRKQERDATKQVSQHIGSVGARLELELTVVFVTSWEGQWGKTWLTVMVDEDGNKFVQKGTQVGRWDTDGSWQRAEKGARVVLKATVKSHGERDGEKQTVLSRPKVQSVTAAPASEAGEDSTLARVG